MNFKRKNPAKYALEEVLKWAIGIAASVAVLGLCVGVYNAATAPVPGEVFTGTAKGFGGDVTANITIADGEIVDVNLTGESETPGIGSVALEVMPAQILEAQSAEVDGHTGATVTSTAVRTAVNSALEQAGLYTPPATEAETEPAAEAAPAGPALGEIMASYQATKDNSYIVDYLETDPYLVSIYEGFGFAKQYGSARGHEYCLEDLKETARPHPLANCLTCKTSDFTEMVLKQGVSAYALDYNEVIDSMQESVGCYTCHGDNAATGELVVTHDYFIDKLDMSDIAPATLSCGQCHIEYYFVPETKATSIPYTNVAEMTPEAMLAYYDEMGFADWTQASTGTPLLKAQHPEMETFLNGSIHASMGMNCASCHMEKVTGDAAYTSHNMISPLESPAIVESCASCHPGVDIAEKVHTIQAEVTARETEVGNKLASYKQMLADAMASGEWSEEDLTQLRTIHRHAQWFFDYCYVENAEGAHNSRLAYSCLDKSDALIDEGMTILAGKTTEAAPVADGTFTATTKGFGGDVTAEITVAEGKITEVKLTGENETPGLGGKAIEDMPALILEAQSAEVDGVTGATITSDAVRAAVTSAMEQAGLIIK